MVKRKVLTIILAMTLVITALLAGCGSGSGNEGSTGEQAAAQDGHINAALYWFGTSLDPATEYDGWTTCRAGLTETLVTVDKNYEIQPLLAESWEQKDDVTWVMHIRDGVTFHDGTPVDGAAVKAAFDRAMEVQERAKTAAKIKSIEADGQDVTFVTEEPFGAFLANISEPMYSIVKVGDDQDYANAPIATGPFKVTGFKVNDEINTERYDGYWNGASSVKTMTIKCIEEDSTRGLALQSGEQDVVQRVANADLPNFKSDSNYQVIDTTGARVRIIIPNMKNEFLQDVNVRKALAAAIDYDSLVKVLGDGVTNAQAPYPKSAPYGYDELDKQHYDAAEAAKCLEAAGFKDSDGNGYVDKDGKELKLTLTYQMADYTSMLEAVQSMAKECGINIELKLADSIEAVEEKKDFDLICTNWQVLSTGDPQWFLDTLYKTGAQNNCISYSNKELDKIIDQLSTAFDLKERQKLTIEAEKILLDDCATIYLVGENNFVVANQKVQNIVPYPIDYYFIDNGMSVAE
ncbi:MAG: ABC transporter substrate-binding protein [Eubacterium sp.]|nr:ABC transporter substrate-binding protein [Eubacterium sp.]